MQARAAAARMRAAAAATRMRAAAAKARATAVPLAAAAARAACPSACCWEAAWWIGWTCLVAQVGGQELQGTYAVLCCTCMQACEAAAIQFIGACTLLPSSLLPAKQLDHCPAPFALFCAAALHVASATGRADVVHQLAAAGASLNKALPMDYRALLRQAQQEQQAQQGHAAADSHGHLACDAAAELAAAGHSQACCEDELCGGWGEAAAEAEGRAPPPKRGRYVTAGPAGPGPPSLQYCTALHCAALGGHLEAVQALLATGQVGGLVGHATHDLRANCGNVGCPSANAHPACHLHLCALQCLHSAVRCGSAQH